MTRKEFCEADSLIDRISKINEALRHIECSPNMFIKCCDCIINARSSISDVPSYQIRLDEKILETIRAKIKVELLAHKARMEKKLSDFGITIDDWEQT